MYDGGYYLHKFGLLRLGLNAHTSEIERPFSDETLEAINTIQDTPFRINTLVRDVMQRAWDTGLALPSMVCPEPEQLPPPVLDAVWAGMSEEERSVVKSEREAIHSRNAENVGKRWTWLARLDMAREMEDEPAIWFPHFADFRGRIYPMVSELSPQGDDVAKALLMFAHGKPLGDVGMAWLCIRAATCFGGGFDKASFDDRIAWAMAHEDEITSVAADPLGDLWWTEAEEPWMFLATCFELTSAFEVGPSFVSRLPIPLDGSCNGLQHLAALARDPIGAAATNVLPGAERRDIYSDVAASVLRRVTADAGRGDEIARLWLGKVTRKVVKRAVMTTPYGVTSRGIRDQIVRDGHVKDMEFTQRGQAADYMRDCIVEAMVETGGSAKAVMAWFQAVASVLADHGQPFRWETPTGNTIQQSYYDLVQTRVQTLAGTIALQVETPEAGLLKRKQALAAAPNVIHSFDAAHLCRTVNACVSKGVRDFAMIHDSYATLAADTGILAVTLREEFVRIYKDNWLQRIEDYVRGYAGDVIPSWTEYVTLGDLEIEQVQGSEFFFA